MHEMTSFRSAVFGGLGLGFGFTIAAQLTQIAYRAANAVGTPAFQETAKTVAGATVLVAVGIVVGVAGLFLAIRSGFRGGS